MSSNETHKNCSRCGNEGVFYKYVTFEYWFCKNCKDEIIDEPKKDSDDKDEDWHHYFY